MVKFIYSEKATKFCEIFPLLLTLSTVVNSKGKISQNFVAFSEYMNFNRFDPSNIQSEYDVIFAFNSSTVLNKKNCRKQTQIENIAKNIYYRSCLMKFHSTPQL